MQGRKWHGRVYRDFENNPIVYGDYKAVKIKQNSGTIGNNVKTPFGLASVDFLIHPDKTISFFTYHKAKNPWNNWTEAHHYDRHKLEQLSKHYHGDLDRFISSEQEVKECGQLFPLPKCACEILKKYCVEVYPELWSY